MSGASHYIEKLSNKLLSKLSKTITLAEQYKNNREKEIIRRHLSSCGQGVMLNGKVHLSGADSAIIGNNVHIGDNAYIRAEGGLEIGDNTHISRNLVLYTINHDHLGKCLPYDDNMIKKPVYIGRNVWIGMNVCIAPGTSIGDGAIIGMGTVLFGSVPPYAIVGSAPWRQIGTRDISHYDELEQSKAYGGVNGRPLEASKQ